MGSPPPADKDYRATLLSFSFILPLCFYPFPPMAFPHRSRSSFAFLSSFPRLPRRPLLILLSCKRPHSSCVMDVFHMQHTLLSSITCPAAAEASYQTAVIEQLRSYFKMHWSSGFCLRTHTHTRRQSLVCLPDFYVCQPSKVSINVDRADFRPAEPSSPHLLHFQVTSCQFFNKQTYTA